MSAQQEHRLWGALSNNSFRSLWLGSVAVNLTLWMHSVAAAWLMVSLNASPLMVALIQTASALPSFIFALPSGVMADLVDRRRYLIAVLAVMAGTAAALCLLFWSGQMGPWWLLFFTFCLGTGFALQGPAWYVAQTDAVARPLLLSAMSLSSVSYSSARAVGPALAGVVVASQGVQMVFVTSVFLLLAACAVLLCWNNTQQRSNLPPEDLWSGLRSAVRYVRHSEVVKTQVLRTASFVGVSSSLWALLPLIAGGELNSGARGYGLLLGSMGAGSVVGAVMLPRLRSLLEMNRLMALAAMLYAGSMVVAAVVPDMLIVCVALFLAGAAWLCVGNTNMIALQSAVPAWIRARVLSIYMLAFQGAMAVGSAIWGVMADKLGASHTLLASALLMGVVLWIMQRRPARTGNDAEATQAEVAPLASDLVLTDARIPAGTPVAIQVRYQIADARRSDFLRCLHAFGKVRRRDGASFWRVYRDLGQEGVYIERFLVESWDQYLRQRHRATLADIEAERQLWAMHEGSAAPLVSHFVPEPAS